MLVPGGAGTGTLLDDPEARSKYITSVRTGSLFLAAAGLHDGYKAACHWAAHEILSGFKKVTLVKQRMVEDRNRLTGGRHDGRHRFRNEFAGQIAWRKTPTSHNYLSSMLQRRHLHQVRQNVQNQVCLNRPLLLWNRWCSCGAMVRSEARTM